MQHAMTSIKKRKQKKPTALSMQWLYLSEDGAVLLGVIKELAMPYEQNNQWL